MVLVRTYKMETVMYQYLVNRCIPQRAIGLIFEYHEFRPRLDFDVNSTIFYSAVHQLQRRHEVKVILFKNRLHHYILAYIQEGDMMSLASILVSTDELELWRCKVKLSPEPQDVEGAMILTHAVISSGFLPATRHLIEHYTPCFRIDWGAMLKLACQHRSIVRYLCRHHQAHLNLKPSQREDILVQASLPVFKFLLDPEYQIWDLHQFRGFYGRVSLLHSLCQHNQVNKIRFLLAVGLTVEDVRSSDNFSFRICCYGGYLELARLLYYTGLTLDDVQDQNNDAVQDACRGGFLDLVRFLFEEVKLPRTAVQSNSYAGFYACKKGHLSVVQYLVGTLGLEFRSLQIKGECGLCIARRQGHVQVVNYLQTKFQLTDHKC